MRTGLLFLTCCSLLAACAAPKQNDQASADGEGWEEVSYRVVTAPHTPLFSYGPAQATGADTLLKKGALVRMVKAERGFSRVRTEDDIEGYVANDRLAEATPDQIPSAFGATSMGLPEFRTDTTSAPEWLQVGTVDEMLIQNPPGELLLSDEEIAAGASLLPETQPLPEAAATPEPTPTPTPDTHVPHDHQ